MNALYVSYDGMTDPLGGSQVLPYLEGLAARGHRITLVSFEKHARYKTLKDDVTKRCEASGIDWQPMLYTKRPPVLSTLYDVKRMQRKANQLHRQKKFSVVHCRSYIASLVGLTMKKKYGVKFIFDMRGFWADERVDGGLWNMKNPLYRRVYRYFKQKEKEFLQHADCTVSLTQNAADEIRTWQLPTNKPLNIVVISCCADLHLFDPQNIQPNEQRELMREHGLTKDDFVLSYIGSLGTWYLLDEMLRFFKTLLTVKPSAKFLIITNDPQNDVLARAASFNIPTDRIVITQAPRRRMPLYISVSHATLFFIKPSYSKKASSPVKQGEAMGMGIPIICNAGIGDTDAIVTESRAGIVLQDFSDQTFEQAAQQILNTMFDSTQIRRGAERFYSLDNGIEKYARIYASLEA